MLYIIIVLCLPVMTGCTDGIGKAFAQELVSHGMYIVIVSLSVIDCRRMSDFLGDLATWLVNVINVLMCSSQFLTDLYYSGYWLHGRYWSSVLL